MWPLVSALTMAFLYTLQMGSHLNSQTMAPKLLTLSMSILTLIFFVFYAGDITAEMTSGPPGIPIKTFEDVIYHEYRVVVLSPYYEKFLANSEPSSAKNEVFKSRYKLLKSQGEMVAADRVLHAVVNDPHGKTLLYGNPAALIPSDSKPHRNILKNQMFALKMDDSVYTIATLALQKDSEFLQIFNYYILKAFEGGHFKRLYRKYHMDLFIKENFAMAEPMPLGSRNVMFCFISIGFGICLSLIFVMVEFSNYKIIKG